MIDLVELFKTPALSALIGASAALGGIPLTQWLGRKAAHTQWLREKRANAYADLLFALDKTVLADQRAAKDPRSAYTETYLALLDSFRRAMFTVQLYGHPALLTLLAIANQKSNALVPYFEANALDGTTFAKNAELWNEIRPEIVHIAREESYRPPFPLQRMAWKDDPVLSERE